MIIGILGLAILYFGIYFFLNSQIPRVAYKAQKIIAGIIVAMGFFFFIKGFTPIATIFVVLSLVAWRGYLWPNAHKKRKKITSNMTRAEALGILNLKEIPTTASITNAYERLMEQNDKKGVGNEYFTAKLNEAKYNLLGNES